MKSPMQAVIVAAVMTLTACATTAPALNKPGTSSAPTVITAVATINAWGSILAQLGGVHVHPTSLISNPDTDPHDYEPTPADARTIAGAALFVENGIGYDTWAAKALAADAGSGPAVINVGVLTKTPTDGNPHRWYSPTDVETVADAITAALTKADPADADYFTRQRRSFESTGLAGYHQLIKEIRTRYAGTPVGASESIFSPMSDALGLNLLTPAGFLRAISQGSEPSAADKSAIDRQIRTKQIKILVFNSQNATPDVTAQVAAAKTLSIPVVAVTETLTPAGASFQDWQSAQLTALQAALAQGTGK